MLNNRVIYGSLRNVSLPPSIENALTEIFIKEIAMKIKINNIKEDLISRRDFNIMEIFKLLDVHNNGFIDYINLLGYFYTKDIVIHKNILMAFIQRFDKDMDCKLTYYEFKDGIIMNSKKKEILHNIETSNYRKPFSEMQPGSIYRKPIRYIRSISRYSQYAPQQNTKLFHDNEKSC